MLAFGWLVMIERYGVVAFVPGNIMDWQKYAFLDCYVTECETQ